MIQLTAQTRILLATRCADFRKGIDGMAAICRLELAKDPRSGTLFVFINRSRTMIRALQYDGSGFWLMTKRLSKGTFQGWPAPGEVMHGMDAARLSLMLRVLPREGKAAPAPLKTRPEVKNPGVSLATRYPGSAH